MFHTPGVYEVRDKEDIKKVLKPVENNMLQCSHMSVWRRNRPLIIFLLLTVLVIALTATSIYFYQRSRRVSIGSTASDTGETKALIAEVGKLMFLPENETPTIATVSDPSKLKDQSFFVDAKEGDKVLIYTNAKKAILYDPLAKKIVNVAPINLGANTPGTTAQ
jgi:hypothetical protein